VQLTATGDHKILAQIKAGHTGQNISRSVYEPTPLPLYLARPHKKATKCPFVAWPSAGVVPGLPGVHEPRALLLGLLLGDGHIPKNGEYQLSCADPQLLADTRDYVRECGFEFIKPKQGYSHYMRAVTKHKQARSETNKYGPTTNPFKLWIRDIGLHGKLAYEKQLPADIWFWDDASVLQLVAGLFATDGCVYLRKNGCSVYFDSTSFELLDELKRVLEIRFGIWCTATQRILKDKMQWAKRDRYRFSLGTVAAVRRFAELISLPGKKQVQLQKGVAKLSNYRNSTEIGFKLQTVVAAGWHATYDLEVDHPDHLFVLENGLVVSNSTAKAGFTNKQLNAITHRLLVTAKDQEDEYDPTTLRGLPVDTSDPSNVGALLAHDVGGYKRNQTLSPRILKDLKSQGLDNILVRSPTVGGPKDGGVYAYDTGVRERGGLAPTGDWVGLAGAQALGETITQSMLSSKHSGGVAGSAAGGSLGYPAFSNLLQAPEVFNGAAAHAQRDGRVQSITEAPQGGTFVTVDGQEHYVPVGRKVEVKQNDEIEAGDMLSDGIPHPSEIVKHKGIGEGRRYFTNAMRQVAIDSGTKAHRRNIELLSRGLINHVRLTDEYEDGVPGETMPYQTLEASWVPRDGHTIGSPASMKNQYLERPNLHYSIGTRITPSVIKMMNQYGVKQVYAHRDPPPFEPTMVRAMASTAEDRDWMTNMLGSYQKSSLLDAAHRGRSTDTQGSSYVPALAAGSTFGVSGLTKGWDPKAGIDLGPDFETEPIKPIKPLAPSALD
jgi:LAGLIDADG-like domain/RNA polymerase Rpb1, domain 5